MSVYAGPIKTRIDGARYRNDFEATAHELVNRVDDRLGVNDHSIVLDLECRFSALSFCKLSSAARGRSTISVVASAHDRRFVVSIFEQVGSEMGLCQLAARFNTG
jgi:hypothetical protein